MITTELNNKVPVRTTVMNVSSKAFEEGGFIPWKYTCDGANINPPLYIEGIPKDAKSLVLLVLDPDAPINIWDHWLVWNIKPKSVINENSIPGIQGLNSFLKVRYNGPCPPSGTHRYLFKVYALDTVINLEAGANRRTLEKQITGHVMALGMLSGRYKRIK